MTSLEDVQISEIKAKTYYTYAKIILSCLIPAVLVVITFMYDRMESDINSKKVCIRDSIELVDTLLKGEKELPLERRDVWWEVMATHYDLLGQTCKLAGLALPITIQEKMEEIGKKGSQSTLDTVKKNLDKVSVEKIESQVSTRIFIHIANDAQREAAKKVWTKLEQYGKPELTMKDHDKIIVPGIEKVANGIKETQLRCLKREDCEKAKELEEIINGILADPISVKDLSEKYEGNTGIKRRTYELWFPNKAIALK